MTYEEAINSTPTVLVEFYATWCPHCRRMAPVVDQLKQLLAGSADIYQLDIDQNTELCNIEHVDSTPTFIIYRNGKEVWRHSGEIDGNVLLAKVQQFS